MSRAMRPQRRRMLHASDGEAHDRKRGARRRLGPLVALRQGGASEGCKRAHQLAGQAGLLRAAGAQRRRVPAAQVEVAQQRRVQQRLRARPGRARSVPDLAPLHPCSHPPPPPPQRPERQAGPASPDGATPAGSDSTGAPARTGHGPAAKDQARRLGLPGAPGAQQLGAERWAGTCPGPNLP